MRLIVQILLPLKARRHWMLTQLILTRTRNFTIQRYLRSITRRMITFKREWIQPTQRTQRPDTTCPTVNTRISRTYRMTIHLVDVAVGLSPAVVFAVEPVIIQAIPTLSLQLNLSAKELKARRPDRKLGGEKIQSAV